jgi:hypothetical protein
MPRCWLFVLVALACACRSPALGRPPRPAVESWTPADFFPNDLDFVVRIDLARLRNEPAFGDSGRRLANAGNSGMLRSILPMLEQARALFVGGRWMSDGFHGDGVVAIEASAPSSARDVIVDPTFRPIERTPRHVSIFERRTTARDEAALEIVLERGGIVLATAAEEDAVLRVIARGPDLDRLDPPAHGLVSFAVRRPERGETLFREFGEGLARCLGSVEVGQAIEMESELLYTSEEGASRAAAALRSLLERLAHAPGPLRSVADSVKLARQAEILRLRASVPFAVLSELH